MNKKIIGLLLAVITLLSSVTFAFTSCGGDGDATKLSFKSAMSYDYLKTLDGERVTINGYMADGSPVDGSFIFLMNLPYQNCPFCIPNTTELANTIEVYPKDGKKFEYDGVLAQVLKVVGTLEVADSVDEPFTDMFGYKFNFKIVDATYSIVSTDELSADVAAWQKIAESGIIEKVYKMYDYVNFVCTWNDYVIKDSTSGKKRYLVPGDLDYLLYTEVGQFSYGMKDGYFDGIIDEMLSVDGGAFEDLVENIEKAESLALKAIANFEAEKYSEATEYVESFDNECSVYTMDEDLYNAWLTLYYEFSDWIGKWEL